MGALPWRKTTPVFGFVFPNPPTPPSKALHVVVVVVRDCVVRTMTPVADSIPRRLIANDGRGDTWRANDTVGRRNGNSERDLRFMVDVCGMRVSDCIARS